MSKEQEYQQKLEIIKDFLGIDYLYISILEFEREIEKIVKEMEMNNNEILNLNAIKSEIEDLEDEIEDLKDENKKLKEQLKNKT